MVALLGVLEAVGQNALYVYYAHALDLFRVLRPRYHPIAQRMVAALLVRLGLEP